MSLNKNGTFLSNLLILLFIILVILIALIMLINGSKRVIGGATKSKTHNLKFFDLIEYKKMN